MLPGTACQRQYLPWSPGPQLQQAGPPESQHPPEARPPAVTQECSAWRRQQSAGKAQGLETNSSAAQTKHSDGHAQSTGHAWRPAPEAGPEPEAEGGGLLSLVNSGLQPHQGPGNDNKKDPQPWGRESTVSQGPGPLAVSQHQSSQEVPEVSCVSPAYLWPTEEMLPPSASPCRVPTAVPRPRFSQACPQ